MNRPMRLAVAFIATGLSGAAPRAQAQVPAPASAPPQTTIVFFPEWSGALDDASLAVIRHAADIAGHVPSAEITVTGYADSKGSPQADTYLSELRAQRVTDRLVADGVPRGRVKLVARGRLPLAGLINRRVEIAIIPSP